MLAFRLAEYPLRATVNPPEIGSCNTRSKWLPTFRLTCSRRPFDSRFTALEQKELLARNWHLACHVSEIAQPGDYITFTYLGERIAVARL